MWRSTNSEPYLCFICLHDHIGFAFAAGLASYVLPDCHGDSCYDITRFGGLETYFLIIGLSILILTPGYLYFAIQQHKHVENKSSGEKTKGRDNRHLTNQQKLMAGVFIILQFLHSASFVIGQQLPIYASESHLKLSTSQGASLTMIFWISYACGRLISTLVATKVSAARSIYIYIMIAVCPCFFILFRQENLTYTELLACLVLLGMGGGPIFPISMAFCDHYMHVTQRLSGIIYYGDVLATIILSSMGGQIIYIVKGHPELLFLMGLLNIPCLFVYIIMSIFDVRLKNALKAS